MDHICKNWAALGERIARAAARAGRDPDAIEVVAISKTRSAEEVEAAYECGLCIAGENRIQEAAAKRPLVAAPVSWHLVGHLQTNKAKFATRLFDVIHSVDSERLAAALETEAAKLGRTLEVLVQLNVSGEEAKFGLQPVEAEPLLAAIADMPHLRLTGLMTMAPVCPDPEDTRPIFRDLRQLRDDLRGAFPELTALSMGMTQDYAVAIQEGATLVRIGAAIFQQ